MYDPHTTYWLIRENARRLAKENDRLRGAAALSSAHSRAALLARFLQHMADRIDPTGEARRPLG
jgi:hypothetical protein